MPGSPRPLVPSKLRVPNVSGLTRERVLLALDRVWDHRLGLVLAPPGAGKTTALAQYATTAQGPVAWYRAESTDGRAATLIAYVSKALSAALDIGPAEPADLESLVAGVEAWGGPAALLIVDDLHMLEGTEAERELERLLDLAPPSLHILAGSRRAPSFNLPRLRVAGALLEVDGADLRFRSWEVEQLFRSVYGEPLPPEELATLSRRTEGWAAGLQLFHLATAGKPVDERREAVASLTTRSRLVRGYLTRNVLEELPEKLREFLVETSVLGRLTSDLCDQLRGRPGSQRMLEEIERREFFLIPLDDEDAYRMHEVLRSHLEAMLIEQVGAEAALERYGLAAVLLEEAGAVPEALHAYCRASQWADAARLLGDRGDRLGADPGGWLELLPAELAEHDPWLVLARARRAAADGRLPDAISAFRQAEARFGSSAPAEACRRERHAVAVWADPSPVPTPHWSGPLRAAVRRDPLAALPESAGPLAAPEQLVAGLARLLYGQLPEARRDLAAAGAHPEAGFVVQATAQLAEAASLLLEGGTPATPPLQQVARRAEDRGLLWLARQARAMTAAAGSPPRLAEMTAIQEACHVVGDDWGSALVTLLLSIAQSRAGQDPRPCAVAAAVTFRRLGAGVLEAAALGMAALGARGDGAGRAEAVARARTAGRLSGSRWGPLLAALAAGADSDARVLATECGVSAPAVHSALFGPAEPAPSAPEELLVICCLGEFTLRTPSGEVSLAGLKPRPQELLRLLAARAGKAVHREGLVAALWPEAELSAGMHNLHTAVSALRRFLDSTVGREGLIARDGAGYRLAAPELVMVDVLVFAQAVRDGRTTEGPARERALCLVLSSYGGDLLAGDGTVEWVVQARQELRGEYVDAATALARLQLAAGSPREAARACQAGLRADRYRDELWRLLIQALARCDDHAASARARRSYEAVLAELGVPPEPVAAG
ncbi:MAG: BTAD domain-containing putative transcriptional regulator [Pseudonocardiales bacterium]